MLTLLLVLLLANAAVAFFSFAPHCRAAGAGPSCLFRLLLGNDADGTGIIDRQSDDKYGRGVEHISADLSEGDIIAYQDDIWYVDGTEVGDGSESRVRYMQVDTIQLVWTHDCEHGVINGFDVTVEDENGELLPADSGVERGSIFAVTEEYLQIGPEQVLARMPTVAGEKGTEISSADFHPSEEMMSPS